MASGEIQIVAVARRPGVLTKVAVRSQAMATIGGDDIARVRDRLDGERIDVVTWDHAAPVYISAALGVGKVPPMLLLPAISHARVLFAGCMRAGRKLAKVPRAVRSPRIACSGRTAALGSSHFGPPTAPNRIA